MKSTISVGEVTPMGFKAPLVGEWYSDILSGQTFEVIAFDERSSTIEIQYMDGELSEIEKENWATMNIEPAAAPEDWAASYEIQSEDSGFYESYGSDIQDPLSMIEPDSMLGFDEFY